MTLLALSIKGEVPLLNDTFAVDTLNKGGFARDDRGWQAAPHSSWKIGTGNQWMYNTSNAGAGPSDGAVARIIPLKGLGLTAENQLKVDLRYVSWDGAEGDNLYIHLWGLVDVSSTPHSRIANMSSQNGNLWVTALDNGLEVYNLADGSPFTTFGQGKANTAAIKLMNQDTESPGIEAATVFSTTLREVGTLADYDYLVIGITRDPTVGRGNGTAFYDVTLSAEVAVPEPASLALLSSGVHAVLPMNTLFARIGCDDTWRSYW